MGEVVSAERTLHLLSTVGRAYREVSLAELAAVLGWPKATVLRYASALMVEGLLMRNSAGYFSLGPTTWALQRRENYRSYVVAACQPELESAAERTGETAVLVDHHGAWVHVLSSVAGSGPARMTAPVRPLPIHSTALGWVHLAWMTPRQRSLSLRQFEALTPATIRTREALDHELGRVVELGYAAEWGHFDGRMATVAAPVFSYARVALGLGIVAQRRSLSRQRAQQAAEILCHAGERAAVALGVPRGTLPYTTSWSLTDPSERS